MEKIAVRIEAVEPGSPAEKAGVRPGETLLAIGSHPIRDVLDYRFYMLRRSLTLQLENEAGERRRVLLHKGEYEEPGLGFSTYLMDEERHCRNRCLFCFIDQMPPGMRETLYFKDDDTRLGFLFGNYVTLTNLSDEDVERIIAMRLSPVNVSVHTMDPELRVRMMGNRFAGEALRHLRRLAEAGIALHTQLVLCPGINDGPALEYSLRELGALWPAVESVACVPVGLTRYRKGLAPLRPYTPEEAAGVLRIAEGFGKAFLKEHGERLVYPADEFFLKAGKPLPPYEYYGEFSQLENGVGLLALLKEEFNEALEEGPAYPVERRVTLATGEAAAPFLQKLVKKAERRFPGLHCRVQAIQNRFFGKEITVAGLVTATDLREQLAGQELGEELLLSASMLRHEKDRFLDDGTPEELAEYLGVPVRPVENEGEALLAALLGEDFPAWE